MKKLSTVTMILSGIITAAICGVMNFRLIPAIEASTQGIRIFDMNFAYSYETARKLLSVMSTDAKELYLGTQLPLDFIYPAVYTMFFCTVIYRLSGKKALCALPVLLAAFDYTENICTAIMLKSSELSHTLALVGSIATSVKTVLMYSVFLLIIILIIRYFVQKKKKKA